jgi:hypothetical protein
MRFFCVDVEALSFADHDAKMNTRAHKRVFANQGAPSSPIVKFGHPASHRVTPGGVDSFQLGLAFWSWRSDDLKCRLLNDRKFRFADQFILPLKPV